ncbi:MAG: BREX system ATP-binding protein BrxD [Deltaproteobacteria bacterium]|nr:BREX system ATP-binding protein BrxD [Deltaproteobacteria bacterium]
MSELDEAREIVSALRAGLVPRRGLQRFAKGLAPLTAAVAEELAFVAKGKGLAKWIRGEYGTGKTFAARYLCLEARARKFATSEVQISINDTPLHHLETIYRRLVERLETAADGPHALQAIVEGWLFQVGEEVARVRGLAEDDPAFGEATEERLEDKLADLSQRNPAFAQVLRGYHRALQEDDYAKAQGLLAWLAGQPHTDRSVTSAAGVKGKVDGQAALTFLGGILRLLRQSGYEGLVVVLDEVETIQRMNAQSREKSLNALRQLMDMLAADELPGLYLIVTGTRDFFDGYKGLKGLTALYQRVHVAFGDDATFDNLRAPQVRLLPFDERRLFEVGAEVRALYPAKERERVLARVDDAFLRALVAQVTKGFGGRVSVTPRLFLRELTDVLDRVDQHPEFDPAKHYQLTIDEAQLNPEELAAVRGLPPDAAVDDDESGTADPPKRLDG